MSQSSSPSIYVISADALLAQHILRLDSLHISEIDNLHPFSLTELYLQVGW